MSGLQPIRQHIPGISEHILRFHYRLAPEICKAADRLLVTQSGETLASTSYYQGPQPGGIFLHGPLSANAQLAECAALLKNQVRVYADLIRQGDRLGVVVARTDDREVVHAYLEADPELSGKSKIIRARSDDEDGRAYDPSFDPDIPICILTVGGVKGLEFRTLHWLFTEKLKHRYNVEHYYTVITRTKTRLDLYYTTSLPNDLAKAHAPSGGSIW